MLVFSQSERDFQLAQQFIPGGVNSPVRAFQAVSDTPRFIASAKGAWMTDVDGNDYIDYVGSWGPMILGHANPFVIEAVKKAIENGLSFGAPCEAEIALAKEICTRVKSIEKIRMMNSGTEATMTAIRLARGVTGRDKIVKFEGCYHGHADSVLVKAGSGALTFSTPSSPGVPADLAKHTLVADYNDLDSVTSLFEQYSKQIAAVIVEPIAGNMNLILPAKGFLEGLREICDHHQSLLIFDEVITGFRVGMQGAQSLTNVIPDLTTLGKIIGGGMPVGAVGGRADLMDQLSPIGKIYQAGTLSGNPIAMTAGLATLQQLTASTYDVLHRRTLQLAQGLQALAHAARVPFSVNSCTGLFGFFFTTDETIKRYSQVLQCNLAYFKAFFTHMLNAGVYFAPSAFEAGFVSVAHSEEIVARTLLVAERVFSHIK